MARRAYEELRSAIEQLGGTMEFTGSGYGSGGAWIAKLNGKQAVFKSNGAGFPELDTLYVPAGRTPKHHSDYTTTLIDQAIPKLLKFFV